MKAKIDLEKFVRSLMERYYETHNIDCTTTECWLDKVLKDQGLEYKDGEIVEIEQEPKWVKTEREAIQEYLEQAKKFNKERLMEVAKPETPEEKAEAEERAIVHRLDRIIELLERPILMPYSQPVQPLQPYYYGTTASTEGGEE